MLVGLEVGKQGQDALATNFQTVPVWFRAHGARTDLLAIPFVETSW
jgi:hypothetical protein